MTSFPELLAPAGDLKSFKAAVENGADAVYLGIEKYSARAYASNFSLNELEEIIDTAHLKGVKVYIAINTIIKDSEFSEIFKILQQIVSYGIDAVIVQDIGLISILQEYLPDLPLHASTQMTVHNLESVKLLENLGFKRVILARELSLKSISYISKNTDIELEVFIHGALCICYSGQCLFSSIVGNRSGNRGHCAQPCRKQYKLKQNGTVIQQPFTYLLSPKDLNTSTILPDIINTGVKSLKIEGRMKRPEYVAGVVKFYRMFLDRYIQSEYFVSNQELRLLKQLFNRGFTNAYLCGIPRKELMDYDIPVNRGICIGNVVGIEGKYTHVKLNGELKIGDGIGFSGSNSGEYVTKIISNDHVVSDAKNTIVSLPLLNKVSAGTIIYKTLDSALMKSLSATFDKDVCIKKIPVKLKLKAVVGLYLELQIEDLDKNTICIKSDYIIEEAKKAPTTADSIKKQILKFGNSVFDPVDINLIKSKNIFIPVKELNQVRSNAVKLLTQKRIKKWKTVIPNFQLLPPVVSDIKYNIKKSLIVCVNTKESLVAAIKAGANIIYFGDLTLKSYTDEELKDIYTITVQSNCQVYLYTPVILWDDEFEKAKKIIQQSMEIGFHGLVIGNLGILKIAKELNYNFIIDHSFNVFNIYSLMFFLKAGAQAVTLSLELSMQQMEYISNYGDVECLVYGDIQLMVTENCIISSLLNNNNMDCVEQCKNNNFSIYDEKGFTFPVVTDDRCRNHIFNSRKMCLFDDISDILKMGIHRLRIDVRNMDIEEISKVISAFRCKVDGVDLEISCRNLIKNYTKGNYFKKIL